MESDMGSENEDCGINEIESENLTASHREILEKLKRQEQEEREEIERELREAQKEALVRARQHDELRAQELRAQEQKHPEDSEELEKDTSSSRSTPNKESEPTQTEIKTQRPLGLLAQHGLQMTKTHSHLVEKEREKDVMMKDLKEKEMVQEIEREKERLPPPIDFSTHPAFLDARTPTFPHSPPTTQSPSDLLNSQGHHWTFEEQFKQVWCLHL